MALTERCRVGKAATVFAVLLPGATCFRRCAMLDRTTPQIHFDGDWTRGE